MRGSHVLVVLLLVGVAFVAGRWTATPAPAERARKASPAQARPGSAAPARREEEAPRPDLGAAPQVDAAVAAEWDRLLSELRGLQRDDWIAAQALAKKIAAFLAANRPAVQLALLEVVRLDRDGAWLQASVIAVGLGQVPDESVALQLLGLLDRVHSGRVRQYVVESLGQDRHGVDRNPGAWTTHGGLTVLGTPIVEDEVRTELLRRASERRSRNDPVADSMLAVLGFNVDSDPRVMTLFLDMATQEGSTRAIALGTLSMSREPAALAYLRTELAKTTDVQELGSISRGLVRNGTAGDVRAVMDALRRDDLSIRAKRWLVNALVGVRSDDAAVLSEVGEVILRLMKTNDEPALQASALVVMPALVGKRHRVEEFVRETMRIARDGDVAMSSRIAALAAVGSLGSHAAQGKAFLWELAISGDEDLGLRSAALRRWIQLATNETVPAMLDELARLKTSADGRGLAAAIEYAERRLRMRLGIK